MSNHAILVKTAKREALKSYHGILMCTEPNIQKIIKPFPWTLEKADGNWCAAFVYYCCILSGFVIPIRPKACVSSNLAGCAAWEEWAKADERIAYCPASDTNFTPIAGDIVLYDRVFIDKEHDHIGIITKTKTNSIVAAEGNINNISGIIERQKDTHIRAYIRIPDNFSY